MQWFPDLATPAFCETVQLRKMILERQQSPSFSPGQVLEPASAEFIAALAAGINSHNLLQIGVGLSTIALAAAARVTGGFLVSVQTDKEKQEIVHCHMKYLGLLDFVEFIVGEPSDVIPRKKDVDFAFLMGDPKEYIKLFDLLNLKNGAIVAADNALNEASNDYIRHVRRQPGVESSTLPLARGIEVTKMASWEKFKSGRIRHTTSELNDGGNEETMNQPSLSVASRAIRAAVYQDRMNKASSLDARSKHPHDGGGGAFSSEKTGKEELTTASQDSKPINRGPGSSASVVEEPKRRPSGLLLESDSDEVLKKNQVKVLHGTEQGKTMARMNEEISQPLNDLKSPSVARTEHMTAYDCTDSLGENAHATSPFGDLNDKQDPQFLLSSSLNREEVTSDFEVHFKNYSSQTEVLITGTDQEMLLTDITMAFNDMRVSVKRAKISTRDKLVEDVFYVVDGKTRAPIHPSQWDAVRDRILQRIGNRRGPVET